MHTSLVARCFVYAPLSSSPMHLPQRGMITGQPRGEFPLPGLKAGWLQANMRGVSTIGAGDTFIAGMLYSMVCCGGERFLRRSLEFAAELAGRKVQRDGFQGLGSEMETRQ